VSDLDRPIVKTHRRKKKEGRKKNHEHITFDAERKKLMDDEKPHIAKCLKEMK